MFFHFTHPIPPPGIRSLRGEWRCFIEKTVVHGTRPEISGGLDRDIFLTQRRCEKKGDVPFRARTWAVTHSPAFFCWPSYHAITWITTVKVTPGSEHAIVARISESWFRLKALQTSVVSSPATNFWREPHELLGFVEISVRVRYLVFDVMGSKVLTIGF